jgi:hypothetical protein
MRNTVLLYEALLDYDEALYPSCVYNTHYSGSSYSIRSGVFRTSAGDVAWSCRFLEFCVAPAGYQDPSLFTILSLHMRRTEALAKSVAACHGWVEEVGSASLSKT